MSLYVSPAVNWRLVQGVSRIPLMTLKKCLATIYGPSLGSGSCVSPGINRQQVRICFGADSCFVQQTSLTVNTTLRNFINCTCDFKPIYACTLAPWMLPDVVCEFPKLNWCVCHCGQFKQRISYWSVSYKGRSSETRWISYIYYLMQLLLLKRV